MSLWAFRFLLWYICIMLVQPQNRFTFLWPLHIADLSFIAAIGLHALSCLEKQRFPIRFGPATILAFSLLIIAMLSQQFGIYQSTSAWNPYIDTVVKNALLLILVEAMATSVERVWAVQMTMLFATLWWVKAGLQLSRAGATYAGDRLMGAAVGLIDNPNGFAFMMCVMLPLYFYAYQLARQRWFRLFFLFCALSNIWIIFETGSRTGLVTLSAMGIFLLPHYGRNRWKSLVVIAVAVMVLYPMTGEKNKARFETIPQSIVSFLTGVEKTRGRPLTQDEWSAEERRHKNADTWALIQEHLIFGVGIYPNDQYYEERFPMATGQVHCEILMVGKQLGLIGMSIYIGLCAIILIGGNNARTSQKHWPAVREMGWMFQIQAIAIIVGGSFSPMPWHPPMMIIAASSSALMGCLRVEQHAGQNMIQGI